jgi:hypothetical protein
LKKSRRVAHLMIVFLCLAGSGVAMLPHHPDGCLCFALGPDVAAGA